MEGSSVVFLDPLVSDFLFALHLELHERLHLFLRARGESLVLAQEFEFALPRRARRVLVEEVGDVHLEDRKDLEEGLEADLVLAVLHATEVRLLNADAMSQIGLREGAILSE